MTPDLRVIHRTSVTGLVTKQRKGREQLVRGNVDTVRRATQLLDRFEAVWRSRIGRMGEILAHDPNGGTR